jgi:hypothetical protein
MAALRHVNRALDRSFTRNVPRARLVDRLAIDAQPCTHTLQYIPGPLGNGAISTRPDIEQELAILADHDRQAVDARNHSHSRLPGFLKRHQLPWRSILLDRLDHLLPHIAKPAILDRFEPRIHLQFG